MALTINPVLQRELLERIRGRRAAVILTLYLLILAGVLYLVYEAKSGDANDPFGPPALTQAASIGRGIFEWLLFFMVLLVFFLVPGQTSGAIAGERERQTLVPMQLTLLRPRSILLGKIGASMAYLVLLVVAALPLLAVGYLIGGITIGQVVGSVAAVVASGIVLACLSAAISTFTRRVQAATVLSYAAMLLLVAGSFLVYGAWAVVDQSRGFDSANPPRELLLFNPIAAIADVVGSSSNDFGTVGSPFDPIHDLVHRDEQEVFAVEDRAAFDDVIVVGPGGGGFEGAPVPIGPDGAPLDVDDGGDPFPFWGFSMILLALLSLLALSIASRRLRTPAASER